MIPRFEYWWAEVGLPAYLERCRMFHVTPTNGAEQVVKFTAWEAYRAALAVAIETMDDVA